MSEPFNWPLLTEIVSQTGRSMSLRPSTQSHRTVWVDYVRNSGVHAAGPAWRRADVDVDALERACAAASADPWSSFVAGESTKEGHLVQAALLVGALRASAQSLSKVLTGQPARVPQFYATLLRTSRLSTNTRKRLADLGFAAIKVSPACRISPGPLPIAIDCQGRDAPVQGSEAWLWVEDPPPSWLPGKAVVVRGEAATTVLDLPEDGVQIEPARLGIYAVLQVIERQMRCGHQLWLHGHCPSVSIHLASIMGPQALLEINLPWLRDRLPGPETSLETVLPRLTSEITRETVGAPQ